MIIFFLVDLCNKDAIVFLAIDSKEHPLNLVTIPQARKAVKSARRIFIKARFGLSEDNVKIPKIEALYFLSNFNDTVTPRDQEMYTDTFGYVDANGDVYLG